MMNRKNTDKQKDELWGITWSYKEGFVVSLGLFLCGLGIEIFNGEQSVPQLLYPYNLIIGLSFIFGILANYIIFSKSKWVWFLRSVPAAISSISLFAFNALLMGLFLQDKNVEGWQSIWALNHVTSSWYYILSSSYLLLSLGTLIIYKIHHFKVKEIGITVSHLGLWLAIFAGSLGSFEVSRLEMRLTEGEMSFVAQDRNIRDQFYELPFAIKLNDFVLEEYPPKVGIVDNKSGKLLHEQGKNIRILDEEGIFDILSYQIEILEYLDRGKKFGDQYYFVQEVGAPQAVKVRAVSPKNDTVIGWLTCGSFNTPYESLKLNESHSLIMLIPEPKNYISHIEIYKPEGLYAVVQLEVNQPYKMGEWKIYQLSFDDEFGKWSDVSVIELVRDPWLPLVYIGIFLMLGGAIYMFWFGRNKRVNS